MRWIAATVTFDASPADPAADLVADIFYTLGLKGVVIHDPFLDPEQDWEEDAAVPPEQPGITGYFADTPSAAAQCSALESALGDLEAGLGIKTHVEYTRINEQDWAEAWKDYFWPQKISDTMVVKPSWREYAAGPDDIILEIDPGMAFGTGTHPTTALCLRMIQQHLKPGGTFLDVGTGSGILMVAAAKLGAVEVWGVDNDETALAVAAKNLQANRIDRFRLSTGNLLEGLDQTCDLVAANILAEAILTLLPHLPAVMNDGGVFICSGIIAAKKDAVLCSLRQTGFDIIEVLEKEGWVAIAARKTD